MVTNETSFGAYLKNLIKLSGMSQSEFYTKLGIKKPYFYDIVSGRVNPPPLQQQMKIVEILSIDAEKQCEFFDLAAKERGDLPADIVKWVSEDPSAITCIRGEMHTKIKGA